MITASRVYVSDVPCEFIPGQKTIIGFTRGYEADRFSLRVSAGRYSDLKLAALKNPVTIKIICADDTSRGKSEIVLKKWYILSRKKVERGWVIFEVADVRWRQNFAKLDKAYNIRSYGGLYRKTSTNNGTPWKCLDAAEDAFKELGFDVVFETTGEASDTLPDNLGNSSGGGWFTAEFAEFGPALLGPVRCDPVPNTEGQLVITNRISEFVTDLTKHMVIAGDIGPYDLHWSKPKFAEIHFEQRIEHQLFFAADDTSTAATRNDTTPQIINVIPNLTKAAQAGAGGDAASEESLRQVKFPHVKYSTYVEAEFIGDENVSKRWFKKALFKTADAKQISDAAAAANAAAPAGPQNSDSNYDSVYQRFKAIESNVRQCRWRRFKVETAGDQDPAAITDELRAKYCQLELGRLQADGTTKQGGVYCDYIAMLRMGYRDDPKANALTAKFSRNIPFSETIAAPFYAGWLAGHREDLIFQIVQDEAAFNRAGYDLGATVNPIGYGNIDEIVKGDKLTFEPQGELTDDFRLAVYMNGLYVGAEKRTHVVTIPLFADGDVDKVVLRVDGITANFGYNGGFPGKLLNPDDVADKAAERADECRRSYEEGRAGYLRCAGVDVITKGKARVAGDVHSMQIVIGARAAASIDTHIMVHAAAAPAPRKTLTTGSNPKRGRNPKGIL